MSREKIIYFCDETSHIDDAYMAVGGIAVNMASISEIEEMVLEVKRSCNVPLSKEIKWSNVKPRRENAHLKIAQLLRSLVEENRLHFHIRFQKLADWDHEMSGPRRKTDTVSRAYYQLFLHRPIAFYGQTCDIFVRPDNGECTELLHTFIPHLGTDARKKHKCTKNPIHSIECRDSKKTIGLQLLDVTLGGLAAIRNERHLRPEISKHKSGLAHAIHEMWDHIDLGKSTPKLEKKFNVWNVKPFGAAPRS